MGQRVQRDEIKNGPSRTPSSATRAYSEESAHDREKDLWLLAMHPVPSFLDRDEMNARKKRAHSGSVFRLYVARLSAGYPQHRTVGTALRPVRPAPISLK